MRTLEINEILESLNANNLDYKILIGNETVGIHYNVFNDGTLFEFLPFLKINTVKKLKTFLGK